MTGYAAVQSTPVRNTQEVDAGTDANARLGVEIRSVNSRFLDLAFRLPDELRQTEPALRELLTAKLKRGKIEMRVSLESNTGSSLRAPATSTLQRLGSIEDTVRSWLPGATALSVADILRMAAGEDKNAHDYSDELLKLAKKALKDLLAAREREGARLAQMLLDRTAQLRALDADYVASLSRSHVAALTTAQLAGLRTAQQAALDAADALQQLGLALARGEVAASVSALDMSRGSILAVVRAPRMAALRPAGGDAMELAGQTLAERWPGVAPDARRPLLLDVLRGHLARILGTTPAQIDVERPLADLGMDSLMAVELAGALEREVGRPVSVMQMIQASSTHAVVELLAASLEAPSGA